MYKQASRQQLRFTTPKGVLTTEQMWDLSLPVLVTLIKKQKEILKKTIDSDLDFLNDTEVKDPENELKFNILKDIYITLKKEKEAIRDEAQRKENNQKILNIIASKKETELQNKSVEELEAMLQ